MKDPDELKKALEGLGPGFEFVRELGRGATAIVYLVRDHELGRDLAVKVIRSSFIHDEEAVKRLQREARLVAQLQHPNIVRVYRTLHMPDGSLALLMEHVPGRNLKEVLRAEGRFSPARTLTTLREVASALAYAHRRKIVHRDVKPENIYIDDEVGGARLADFGVARPWDRDTRLTLPGESLGTPAYMSPEQIDGLDVDGRSDVYSLGLVGYEMLVGEHPWERENLFSIIFKQKHDELPDLSSIRPGAPADLVHLIERAVRKNPDERWGSADALLEALGCIGGVAEGGRSLDDGLNDEPGRSGAAPAVSPVATPATEPASAVTAALSVADEVEAPQPTRRPGVRPLHLVFFVIAVIGGTYGWFALKARELGGVTSLPSEALSPDVSRGSGGGLPPADVSPSLDVGTASALLEVVGGDGQMGPVASTLPVPLTVRVVGGDSSLVGLPVAFRIVEGEGELLETSVRPDGAGFARAALRLGTGVGPVVVEASIQGHENHGVRLEVTSVAGPPAHMVELQGDGQVGVPGETLASALALRVVDELGNPVPDVRVRWEALEGGGRFTPVEVATDSLGRAGARWVLGDSSGAQSAVASLPDTFGLRLAFAATAQAVEPEPAAASPRITAPLLRVSPRRYAVGGAYVCRLDPRGRLSCRGSDDHGQLTGAAGVTLVAVQAGVSHACGLEADGTALCWGGNENGQIGDGTRTDRSVATPVQTVTRFSVVTAGLSHTCGLDAGGLPYCWGRNLGGQLGDGSRDDRTTPGPVASGLRFRALVAGWNHTCALDGGGRAYCWGLNADGQLGDGSRLDRLVPTRVVGATFGALSAGSAHTCGRSGGGILCWGDNAYGQVGDGTTDDRGRPVAVNGLPGSAVQLVTGAVHTCALLDSGQVFCWGQNVNGQLGDGTTQNRTAPVAVAGDVRFRTLEAGGGLTCGLAADGFEYCWGLNLSGQIGDGTRTNRLVPTRVTR